MPPKVPKERIDRLLVDRGLAKTLPEAQALLMAGEVLVDERPAAKPGTMIPVEAEIRLRRERPRYVSRGGLKLEGALSAFSVNPSGLICADIGASTGGFTDCLLQHGAVKVHAVDVGRGLIAEKLRQDPRVVLHEKTNARNLTPDILGECVPLAAADCSFISLTVLLPAIRSILSGGGLLIALVKPQFELEREQVSEGGVVTDTELQRAAVRKIAAEAARNRFAVEGETPSPLKGTDGNQEYFLKLRAS